MKYIARIVTEGVGGAGTVNASIDYTLVRVGGIYNISHDYPTGTLHEQS